MEYIIAPHFFLALMTPSLLLFLATGILARNNPHGWHILQH